MSEIDVTVYETPAARTYNVPQQVSTHVAAMVQRYSDAKFDPLPPREHELVVQLLTFGKLSTDDVHYLHDRFNRPQADDVLIASGGGTALSRIDLFGGEAGRTWIDKIIGGMERDTARTHQDELTACSYDPESFHYIGLALSDEPNLITALARIPLDSTEPRDIEALAANGNWLTVDDLTNMQGITLDDDLTAFVSSAFLRGHDGVLLHPEMPICFLPEMPLLAALGNLDLLDAPLLADGSGPDEAGGHIYAVVDPTDTTAVMKVIKILPGPQVFTRTSGQWQPDPTTLGSLMSVNPPPLVELSGSMLKSVLAQTDAADAAQATSTSNVSMAPAATAEPPTPTIPPAPVTAALRNAARMRHAYATGLEMAQLIRQRDKNPIVESELSRREYEIRKTSMTASIGLIRSLRCNARHLEAFFLPPVARQAEQNLIASLRGSVEESEAARANGRAKGTEALRKYWTTGKGGKLVIRWGTPSDWYRCHAALSKYVSDNIARRMCALYHHTMVGYWPGDRRNRPPLDGATGRAPD